MVKATVGVELVFHTTPVADNKDPVIVCPPELAAMSVIVFAVTVVVMVGAFKTVVNVVNEP